MPYWLLQSLCEGIHTNKQTSLNFQVTSQVLATLRTLSVTDEELQAAKNTFLVHNSEVMQNGDSATEILASNAMSGLESASEMINMISTSDINVSVAFHTWIVP